MKPSSPRFDGTHALKCELATEVLRSSGSLRLQVTGWSMLPAVWPGDTLVIEKATCNAVFEGDIVLFGREQRLFAHRVITKGDAPADQLMTRGDSLPQADPPVSGDELLGKVSFILRNGRCIEPSRSLHFSERAIAALVRNSGIAARMVVGVHDLRQTPLT